MKQKHKKNWETFSFMLIDLYKTVISKEKQEKQAVLKHGNGL